MLEILLGLIFPVVAFVLECYPRLLNRRYGVDIWTHLLYLKEYHRQKGVPKEISNGFMVTGTYDYPPMFITILSKFPVKIVEKYEFVFSPFFDMIHLFIIYIFSLSIMHNMFFSLGVQIVYILTPIVVIENSSATPRSLGYTLFTLVFMSLYFFLQTGNVFLLIGSVLLGSLIFISHRFTTQGFLFFSIIFSFIEKNAIFFAVFLISFFFSLAFSKGFYLKVLQGHLGNLKFWRENIAYRFAHQVKGNYNEYKTTDFVFRVYNQFLQFPPFVLSITNPWTIPVLYILFFAFPTNSLLLYLLLWVVIAYVLALVTIWVPKLRFLGEGQRYLELATFPSSFLAINLFTTFWHTAFRYAALSVYILFGLSALATILVIQRKAIIKDSLRTLTPELDKMYDYLKSLKKSPTLLCIPHQITTNTIYHTGCKVFVNADYTNINKISEIYPYFRKPIVTIMKKYGLDLILLNRDYAEIEDLKLKKYTIVKEFGTYSLIKVISPV